MKRNILKLICLALCMVSSMNITAQQTSLTIDNQTPGWLSSKINYSDQLSVERLKVTGYINGTDYKFLSQLIDNNLKSLDLEDVNIVEGGEPIRTLRMSTGELYYYYIRADLFPQWEEEYNFKNLRWLATPKSAELNLYSLDNDTLIANSVTGTIGSESSPFKLYDKNADGYYLRDKCLVIGDGIKNVYFNHIYAKSGGYNHAGLSNCTIVLPASIEYIEGLKMSGGTLISFINNPESISYNTCPQCLANVSSNKNFCQQYCKIKPFELWVPEGTKQSYLDSEIFNNATNIYEMAPPEKLELDYSRLKLYKEDTALLQVSLTPQNAYFNELTWETSDANIASVTQSGEVTAINAGTVEITVSSTKAPEIKATCQVTVYEHTTGIEMTSTELRVNIGETTCINAQTLPLGSSDNEITWSSDDENIATVDENGNVTGISQGSCTITATAVDGGYTANCAVTVVQRVETLTLEKHSIRLNTGETDYLYAQIIPATADNKKIDWTSSNQQVATVDASGNVTAISGGEAWIKAVSNDNPEAKDSCKVNVSYQSYTLIYILEGEIYQTFSVVYGTTLTPPDVPTKEGYTFSGWKNMPETMPNHDVVVTGTYTINSYSLTYMVDGEEYKTSTVVYGSEIVPEEEPTKEGYTFSGWSEIPETMPAGNVVVTGSFSANSYTLLYMVDGETYKTDSVTFGTALVPEEEPTKEGYTFSGWSEIPETMPAEDVTVTGSFTINQYLLTYLIDGEEYKSYKMDFNTTLTPEPAPVRKGMTFSGWGEMPETMPAHDLTLTGTYNWSKETVDGVIYQVADTLNNYASIVGYEGTEDEAELLSDIEIGEDVYEVYSIAEDALPKTLTIRTSIGRLLLWLWTNGYTNIKETETDRDLSAPEMSLVAKTASSLKLSFANDYPELTETVTVSGTLVEKGEKGYEVALRGLEPDYLYEELATVTLTFEDASYTKAYSFKTEPLTLTAMQPKVVSLGNVIVVAESNLDDEETNVGFEWRRIDWTEEFESRTGAAYLYEGIMEGYIRSLNADRLWKFRPYYTSDAGNTYYCDWKGMDPSDYSFFEPTVHTYEPIAVTDSTAEVKGYAMQGTDDVTSQGFVYWQNTPSSSSRRNAKGVPEDATIVEVSGHVMKATLSDLEYDTEYCFAAFVKTESGETFYGEQQSFKTNSDPDGIKDLKDSKNLKDLNDLNADWYDLSGRKIMNGQSSNRKLPRGIYINGGRKVVVK